MPRLPDLLQQHVLLGSNINSIAAESVEPSLLQGVFHKKTH